MPSTDNGPVIPPLNSSFETEFYFDDAAAAPQLGIKANGKINRYLITQDKVGSTSFSATTNRIQYGTYHGKHACLVVLDFAFRFKPKVAARISYADITVMFRRATDLSNYYAPNAPPESDPHVANMAPKRMYGVVTTVENKRVFNVVVPQMFDDPLAPETRAKPFEYAEHQMEVHGQRYEDDDHEDAPNGVSWDLSENREHRSGVLRDFRSAVVVLNPPGQPMWMEVVVKPSISFSANPGWLIRKNTTFAKLLQLNDQPVPLDGRTPKEGQEDVGCDDFTSPDFPWPKILRLTTESQSDVEIESLRA